jgi:hypothetical protein
MRTYDLMATPLVYPGQVVKAKIVAAADNNGAVSARLRLRAYDAKDHLHDVDGAAATLQPGESRIVEWRLPAFDGQPIAEIGIAISADGKRADGQVLVDYLRWDGAPDFALHRPKGDGDFWRMSWVNGVSFFSKRFPPSFRISQDRGEGIIIHGTRQWTDYAVASEIVIHLGNYGGVAVRTQGLRRYYAARLTRSGQLQIVRVRDEDTTVLAETVFPTTFEKKITVTVTAKGSRIVAIADGVRLEAEDNSPSAYADGGIGLLVSEGALSADEVRISAAA